MNTRRYDLEPADPARVDVNARGFVVRGIREGDGVFRYIVNGGVETT
ncbi:MAG: hypothetical protein AAF645_27550 [Myxococcota bacterium]